MNTYRRYCPTCDKVHEFMRQAEPVERPSKGMTIVEMVGLVLFLLLSWGAIFYALPILLTAVAS